jgi:hypothetical protein
MNATDLFENLVRAGVRFSLREGRLRADAPVGVLDECSREGLREHRDEVLALLRDRRQRHVSALVTEALARLGSRGMRPDVGEVSIAIDHHAVWERELGAGGAP